MIIFKNRKEAGKLLGEVLRKEIKDLNPKDYIILAIPRGGVPIAYEISKITKIPFSIILTKKISSFDNPELALGAVAIDGSFLLSDYAKSLYSSEDLLVFTRNALNKLKEKGNKYQISKPDLKNKNVVIVDDGVATGYTAIVASMYAKNKGAKQTILAVPVCPVDTVSKLETYFSKVICLEKGSSPFFAVGAFYEDFHQVEDEEFFKIVENAKNEGLIAS